MTIGPLPPDVYLYAFGVDGVRLADPNNARVKNGYPGLSSILEISGSDAKFLAVRDVPHGTIHVDYYPSGQRHGDVALLTFNLVNYGKLPDAPERVLARWNSTEVYRWIDGRWRLSIAIGRACSRN